MIRYEFPNKSVLKPGAMLDELNKLFPEYSQENIENIGLLTNQNGITIIFSSELNTELLNRLNNFVENYTDPEVYLTLVESLSDSARTRTTNSLTLEPVSTFILSSKSANQNNVFNSLKTIIELDCESTAPFASLENTTGNITIRIYDITRNIIIDTFNIDISNYILKWKNLALNNIFDKQVEYRTFQVEGLRNKTAEHDCIWQFQLAVSNSNINLTLNSLQYLYYNVG